MEIISTWTSDLDKRVINCLFDLFLNWDSQFLLDGTFKIIILVRSRQIKGLFWYLLSIYIHTKSLLNDTVVKFS